MYKLIATDLDGTLVTDDKNLTDRTIENVKKAFELSKAKVEAESRYLRIKGKDIDNYQKMLSYIIFQNPAKSLYLKKYKED